MTMSNITEIANITNIFELAILFLTLAAAYRLFEKMGMEGWKSFLPGYNEWCLFDKVWEGKYWFISMGNIFLGCITFYLSICGASFITLPLSAALMVIAVVNIFGALIINLNLAVRVSRAFGHGNAFAAGFFFLEPLFTMILGFGKSEYLEA